MGHTLPSSPTSWPRKYYTKAGGRPRLFYVAFGKPDGPLKISASEYRFGGVPVHHHHGLPMQRFCKHYRKISVVPILTSQRTARLLPLLS